jgi:tetrahydromethanopterin S-methyltransferase subunit C
MSSKNTAVFGIYSTPAIAENAVDHLIAKGFSNSAISVLLPDDDTTRAFAHQKHTKAPEGTATGVTTGGVIGGTLGLLAGIGALAIPGVGPLIAAGPIMGALAGLGVGGAVGGIVGALVGMGIPEFEAKRYEGAVKNGGTLLSVHCDTSEQITLAKEALHATGAKDVSASGEVSSGTHKHTSHKHETVAVTEPYDTTTVRKVS